MKNRYNNIIANVYNILNTDLGLDRTLPLNASTNINFISNTKEETFRHSFSILVKSVKSNIT